MRLRDNLKLVDIGAGTGKLTKHLIKSGCEVIAVEPNSNMQSYGRTNVVAENGDRKTLTWMFGTAEELENNRPCSLPTKRWRNLRF